MCNRIAWWLTLGGSVVALFLGTVGAQAPVPQAPRQLPPAVQQAGFNAPPVAASVGSADIDLSRLPPLAQEVYRAARGGSEWLCRVHQPSGRFLAGWVPDLNRPAEGDHYLAQAGATFALARAARVFKDERYAARGRQAVLTLLAETGPDQSDPQARCTTLPSTVVNRLGAAGVLLACIHELPDPASDLLDQGEQLARFIGRRQQADGSFQLADTKAEAVDPDTVHQHQADALYGLMRSNVRRPAAWKIEAARRAAAYYSKARPANKRTPVAVAHAAAFAEAFIQSKERSRDAGMADYAFEMADWLCDRQLRQLDPRHPQWQGGFVESVGGGQQPTTPTAASATCASALIDAARATRQKPDAERYGRYAETATAGLQFVMTLRYTESNTQHFAPAYRQTALLGGFHASPVEGALRLEDTAAAVAALAAYWEHVATPQLAASPK